MSLSNIISIILAFILAIAAILQVWTQTSFSLYFRTETKNAQSSGCPEKPVKFGINMTLSGNQYLDFIIGNGGPGVARKIKIRMKMEVRCLKTQTYENEIQVLPPKSEIPFYGCIEIKRDWYNGEGATFVTSVDTRFLKIFRVSRTFQFDFKGEFIGSHSSFRNSLFYPDWTNKMILIQKVLRLKFFVKALCSMLSRINK